MNSREIVQRTIEFSEPERIAASFPLPYWNDMCHSRYTLPGFSRDWQPTTLGRQEYIDEWGNTWGRVDSTSKGEVIRGALDDWADLEKLSLPDLANPSHFERVRQICSAPDNDEWRIGSLPGFPFNIARKMRRLDAFLMDLITVPDQVDILLSRIEALLSSTIIQYAQAGVDCVMFPEDWGTQQSLMISPKMWRRVFKPGFTRLCATAHENGIKVFMHSCGKITAIIPDLIEAGIDVLQFDQPTLHGIDTLAEFHGKNHFLVPGRYPKNTSNSR